MCRSADHCECREEPQQAEKEFCIKAGFVSRFVDQGSQGKMTQLTERLRSLIQRFALDLFPKCARQIYSSVNLKSFCCTAQVELRNNKDASFSF